MFLLNIIFCQSGAELMIHLLALGLHLDQQSSNAQVAVGRSFAFQKQFRALTSILSEPIHLSRYNHFSSYI